MAFSKSSCTLIVLIVSALQMAMVTAAPSSKMKKQVYFTKVDYDVNNDYLKMNVILKDNKDIADAIPTVDLTADLLVDLRDEIYISSVLSRKSDKQNEYWPLIKSSKLNLCEIMLKLEREPVHRFLMDTLKKNGLTMLSECPIKQGSYSLKDFIIEGTDLPSFTLPGDYKVEFVISLKAGDGEVKIWRMTWFASITNV